MTEQTVTHRSRMVIWAIWLVGVSAYVLSIVNRTSLSALGADASERFAADASAIALFAVLQLAVYGALQIPVGLALDRWGARAVITTGLTLMATGQLVMALTPDLGVAISARVLVGAGDAAVFPSVLRIIAASFSSGRAPLMVQITGLVGGAGQIISVIPLVTLMQLSDWPTAFLAVAGTTLLAAVLTLVAFRDGSHLHHRAVTRRVRDALRESWRHPGTRLAFWTHFTTSLGGHAFAILWGYPFLAQQGLSIGTAGALFTLYVLASAVGGPSIGILSGRFPGLRLAMVLTVVGAQAALWCAVLLWPGASPLGLLVAVVVAASLSGPASMIAFDYVRSFNPLSRLSSATGIVNGAGFAAGVLGIFAIGATLDLLGAGTPQTYTLDAFKAAFATQFPIWIAGIALILYEARRTCRWSAAPSGVRTDTGALPVHR